MLCRCSNELSHCSSLLWQCSISRHELWCWCYCAVVWEETCAVTGVITQSFSTCLNNARSHRPLSQVLNDYTVITAQTGARVDMPSNFWLRNKNLMPRISQVQFLLQLHLLLVGNNIHLYLSSSCLVHHYLTCLVLFPGRVESLVARVFLSSSDLGKI